VTKDFVAKASQRPELRGLTMTLNAASQQLYVSLDREQARTLGVPVGNVFGTLQALFGSLYVSQFNLYSQVWQVIVQAAPEYRSRPDDIKQVYVRSTNGSSGMVPLAAVTKLEYTSAPNLITRFNTFPAAKVTGGAAPGYSSGQALATMEAVAREVLPQGYSFGWSGQAYQEKKVGGDSAMVFIYGLIMVFLILAAQYEKWSLPFSVMMAVPFGAFGALLAVWLRGMENDVYFQIGLLTLVGLAAKNAILIVEFAVMKHEEGMPILEAAVEAARLRFRPILMTSLAFILGAIPLVIATGAGANSRHSIGTGIVGGMTAATVLAIFFVPMFFRLFEGLSEKRGGKKKGRSEFRKATASLWLEAMGRRVCRRTAAMRKTLLAVAHRSRLGRLRGRPDLRTPGGTDSGAMGGQSPNRQRSRQYHLVGAVPRSGAEQSHPNRVAREQGRANRRRASGRVHGPLRRDPLRTVPADRGQRRRARTRYGENTVPTLEPKTQQQFPGQFGRVVRAGFVGQTAQRHRAARAQLLATEEAKRTVILSLVGQLANSYVQLLDYDKQLAVTRATLQTRSESVRINGLRFKAGLISELDYQQAVAEYQNAAVQVPLLERQIGQQENAISLLLGRNPGKISRGVTLDQAGLAASPRRVCLPICWSAVPTSGRPSSS
jgi:hypothetical protein